LEIETNYTKLHLECAMQLAIDLLHKTKPKNI